VDKNLVIIERKTIIMKNQGLKSKLSLELKVNMKKKTPTDRSFSSERDFSIIPKTLLFSGTITPSIKAMSASDRPKLRLIPEDTSKKPRTKKGTRSSSIFLSI